MFNPLDVLDNFLNRITMYKLVYYVLLVYLAWAFFLSVFKALPFDPINLALSSAFLVFTSGFISDVLAWMFKAPVNVESTDITALILALIITPVNDAHGLLFLGWVCVLAVGSKYLFAIKMRHVFNPAAMAAVGASIFLGRSASWWVGTTWMMPLVLVGGYMIVRKIKREQMVVSFILTTLFVSAIFVFAKNGSLMAMGNQLLFHSSLLFLACVMLTDPLTSPTTKLMQTIYGVLVGFLFVPNIHLGGLYLTPESALLVGNGFAYLVNSKEKLVLALGEKIKIGNDLYDFVFPIKQKLAFTPGQYMEWTLPMDDPDSRGNRRYFTIASSPTENNLRLGVKFYQPASKYKMEMLDLNSQTPIVGNQLAGDFVLPKDKRKKLVFFAGGIGVTPFRSILKYLIDTNERRDIIVLYSNKDLGEIVYKDILDEAWNRLGIKTFYALTDESKIPQDWRGVRGRFDIEMIKRLVPDYAERTFYLSGPRGMVLGTEKNLAEMGLPKNQVITDYFPGFA